MENRAGADVTSDVILQLNLLNNFFCREHLPALMLALDAIKKRLGTFAQQRCLNTILQIVVMFLNREHLPALMPALDAIEKRAGADLDAAASSATLWDDICHLAGGMADIPPALRDRMPDGASCFRHRRLR